MLDSAILVAEDSDPLAASTELPEISTTAETGSYLSNPVGYYGNPGWTKSRRFSTTRVYIQRDPWEVGLEQWWRFRTFDDKGTEHLFTEELEIGLPYHTQLDFYYHWTHKNGVSDFHDVAFELRKAFADWDVIPLNPTLYAEYKLVDPDRGPDVIELKLLLGDDIGERIQYGVNFIWEQEVADERTRELQATCGVGYLVNDFFSPGVEIKYNNETVAGSRSDAEHKLLLGPSIQLRPVRGLHLDLVGLFGLTDDAPNVEGYIIFGIDFGSSGGKKVRAPVSGIQN
jgi:hypothetical protein